MDTMPQPKKDKTRVGDFPDDAVVVSMNTLVKRFLVVSAALFVVGFIIGAVLY